MTGHLRTSTGTFDGGGHSIVEQTTDIITRFRNSLVRSRKERLLDEDVQATGNIVNEIHFTELMAKETLGKLILQGNSMQRSSGLINQLEKQIKDIAEDLNEVNGGQCWGACANGTCFGFGCFGCFQRKKKKNYQTKSYSRRKQMKTNQINVDSLNPIRWSSATEREEAMNRTRAFARERREQPDFVQTINRLNDVKRTETESQEKKLNQFRDYLLQHHSLAYGYIDQPERLLSEIDMAIHFTQLNTHLDHLFQMTDMMSNEVKKHNIVITKIEAQAMESGDLLTDYTLLGHHILGSSPTQTPPNKITPNLNVGQKVLLNAVL